MVCDSNSKAIHDWSLVMEVKCGYIRYNEFLDSLCGEVVRLGWDY